jgi:hypothetical protein
MANCPVEHMLPSSAIQVVERTPWRLVVVDPPYYLLGLGFLALCAVSLPVALVVGVKYDVIKKVVVWWAITSLPFLIAGVVFSTGKTIVTFSRENGTLTIARSYIGISLRSRQFPLDQPVKAVVETARAGRSLILLTRAGPPITLTTVTDRGGYYEAADAINEFLRGKGPQESLH